LSHLEREAVLAVLDSDRFVDCAPEAVHAALLEEGKYLCSCISLPVTLPTLHFACGGVGVKAAQRREAAWP
jgi:hypothetical protein